MDEEETNSTVDVDFQSPYGYEFIYLCGSSTHQGYIKVGEATCHHSNREELKPNSMALNEAAHKRIRQYMTTAGLEYELLYTELASYVPEGEKMVKSFSDHDIHQVLSNSGIERMTDASGAGREWFKTNQETILNAIQAVREGRKCLSGEEKGSTAVTIIFRKEQREAIDQAKECFEDGHKAVLWNAKMRFGKTLSALQVVKEKQYSRTLILTHRPEVKKGWLEDFDKIFHQGDNYQKGIKSNRSSSSKGDLVIEQLEQGLQQRQTKYVYFASMQDLRGSKRVGGDFHKNDRIFTLDWDLIIVDEAHVGTQTELGEGVLKQLTKEKTHFLHLSGTPFNLLDQFAPDQIFTWDYIMEQRAKMDWEKNQAYLGPNPYGGLPALSIYTYDMDDGTNSQFIEDAGAFNFHEFFRTESKDDKYPHFVHEEAVRSFVDKLITQHCYPFSTKEYRNYFRHTLWVLPGVNAAKALEQMLLQHEVFKYFNIVNVAGNSDKGGEDQDALKRVEKAIGANPDETWTITLTCGRLTVGVSVPAWTAVLMLYGKYTTGAASYMQTIFRVQTPATINGRIKEHCYVFDFAPDRALVVAAEVMKISTRAGEATQNDRARLGEFLNFCPIIAVGGQMTYYDTDHLLRQLKETYIERAVQSGFEGTTLYSRELMTFQDIDLDAFVQLKGLIGQTAQQPKLKPIQINNQGLTDEEYEKWERLEEKKKKSLSPEEEEWKKEVQEKKKKRLEAITTLRTISIRMPLLLYGAELTDEQQGITIDNFTSLIDDASWCEFMPRGLTKEYFNSKLKRYYDPDVFCGAGLRIRQMAREADGFDIEGRIERITQIFNTFRNPDKETVLTPWRVVNLHLGQAIGGYVFYDEQYGEPCGEPRRVRIDQVTEEIFKPEAALLEINSKSGLYPLYLAYSLYRTRLERDYPKQEANHVQKQKLWDQVVQENIFVVCKTPMAKSITRRTLVGFRQVQVNVRHFENLVDLIKSKPNTFIKQITQSAPDWRLPNTTSNDMKFDAVVGNPPYQEEGNNTRKSPIYPYFYDISFQLSDRVSLITPGRFLFRAGQAPEEWMDRILNDPHFKVVQYFSKENEVFSTVSIKGGVVITYRDVHKNFEPIVLYSPYDELNSIRSKVCKHPGFVSGAFSEIVSARATFRFTPLLFEEHPEAQVALSMGTKDMITSKSFALYPLVFLETPPTDGFTYIQMMGLIDKKRTYRWIRQDYILPNDRLNCYKVLVPEANGTGAIGEVLSTPMIGTPMIGCTDTFLTIGAFDTEAEAVACLKYVKSKFARTLLGILKVTQHNPRGTWRFVPLQDFTSASDIDWRGSVAEVDRQLYEKYGLSAEEIAFIEQNIRPMV